VKVALFYLAKPRFGGWVTYTAHLAQAFRALRHEVRIFKIGKTTETKLRDFGYGMNYRNLAPMDAYAEAKRHDHRIIVAVDKDGVGNLAPVLDHRGSPSTLVIHDPAEMKGSLMEHARRCDNVVTIREPNVATLASMGVIAEYIPHPYVPAGTQLSIRQAKYHATAFSRIDWDKHTDIICGANELLPRPLRITIFGHENRLYTFNKLNKAFPRWRINYVGKFPPIPDAGVVLSSKSHFCVDMSVIKGDGDGTQYTFMEAWDGGAVLVVNRGWLLTGKGAVRDGETAIAVSNAEELVEVMHRNPKELRYIAEAGREVLLNHCPEYVVPRYLDVYRG